MSDEFEKYWARQLEIYEYDSDVVLSIYLNCRDAFKAGRESILSIDPREIIFAVHEQKHKLVHPSTSSDYEQGFAIGIDWIRSQLFPKDKQDEVGDE